MPIYRASYCLAYFSVFENRVLKMDADVLKGCPLANQDLGIGIVFKPRKHVGLDIILEKIYRPFFKLQGSNHRVRDDFDDEAGNRRGAFPVRRIGF